MHDCQLAVGSAPVWKPSNDGGYAVILNAALRPRTALRAWCA